MASEAQLLAISSLDGRDAKPVEPLRPIVSEYGLIKYRVAVEVGWLSTTSNGLLADIDREPEFPLTEILDIPASFSVSDAQRVKEIEKKTNHDVKAVEL